MSKSRDLSSYGTAALQDSADLKKASNQRNSAMNQEPVSQGEATRAGMSSTIYTGDNQQDKIVTTGLDMASGDFSGLIWIKNRDVGSRDHVLSDTVRGISEHLSSSSSSAEFTDGNMIKTITTTGITLGSASAVNATGEDNVAWSWQTNTKVTGVTNRNKTYTTHYNADLGFSITGYKGDGLDSHEIPHHLGVAPELSIFKNRGANTNWCVGSIADGFIKGLVLNESWHLGQVSPRFQGVTEEVVFITDSDDTNTLDQDYISYNFASVEGVCKIGKYTGTGASGNYVDCGFKAGWVMVKGLGGGSNWYMADASRGYVSDLYASLSQAEGSVGDIRFSEDGFNVTNATGDVNAAGSEYLFMAFADTGIIGSNPDKYTKTDYTYPAPADTLTINQDTLISFAKGFNATGQLDSSEVVPSGTTVSLGAGFEDKRLWLYKDFAGSYGLTEYRPLEGITRNDADKWGLVSPLSAATRTTDVHIGYQSDTGVASASLEYSSTFQAWRAFEKVVDTSTIGWLANNANNFSPPLWIQYKTTEKRILKSWRVSNSSASTIAANNQDRTPRLFTVQGSNDGLTWVAVDSSYTSSDYPIPSDLLWGDLQDVSSNTTAYLYHRFYITANHGSTAYTGFGEIELNTVLPSDYYLVDAGVQYNDAGTAIERTYLTEIMTDTDGDVSWFKNLPVGKVRAGDAEFQGDVAIHGELTVGSFKLSGGDDNSGALLISKSGVVTMPNQPHWHGGLGISGGTSGLANISSTRSTRGGLSWSGDRITATVSGVYAISLNTLTQIDSVRRDVYILLNGVAIIQTLNDVADGHHYRSASLTLIMQEGDYIQVNNYLWYDPGTTVTTWKSFSMSLIG